MTLDDIKKGLDYLRSVLDNEGEDTADRIEAARVLIDYALQTATLTPVPGA